MRAHFNNQANDVPPLMNVHTLCLLSMLLNRNDDGTADNPALLQSASLLRKTSWSRLQMLLWRKWVMSKLEIRWTAIFHIPIEQLRQMLLKFCHHDILLLRTRLWISFQKKTIKEKNEGKGWKGCWKIVQEGRNTGLFLKRRTRNHDGYRKCAKVAQLCDDGSFFDYYFFLLFF